MFEPWSVLRICGMLVAVGFCRFETRIGRFPTDAMQCQLLLLHFLANLCLWVWQFGGCNVLLFVLFDEYLMVSEGVCVPASKTCELCSFPDQALQKNT